MKSGDDLRVTSRGEGDYIALLETLSKEIKRQADANQIPSRSKAGSAPWYSIAVTVTLNP